MLYTSTTDGFWRTALHAWCMTWHHCSYATTSMAQQVLRSRYYHTGELYYVSHTIEMCNFSNGKVHLRTCTTERPTLLAASSLHRQGPQGTIAGVKSSRGRHCRKVQLSYSWHTIAMVFFDMLHCHQGAGVESHQSLLLVAMVQRRPWKIKFVTRTW